VAEVTDLLRPADPRRITAADLERSGAAATVVGLLADANLLWEYENREALAQQAQQQQEL
jgi:serine/threonine-protein phosphatase 2A regulatory subunit B''